MKLQVLSNILDGYGFNVELETATLKAHKPGVVLFVRITDSGLASISITAASSGAVFSVAPEVETIKMAYLILQTIEVLQYV